ncbi:hypothetical protein F5Y16DRAFT_405187 [Xylariaceae sp. FL0255]|nr:hypothetical protein F5Y16DRAFT_405187 [Xylariaceae sp. FL0255]
MAPLVCLITGATGGIGKALALELVERGDKVIATGRDAEHRLADLKHDSLAVLNLDVSWSKEKINTQIQKALEIYGEIDVLYNNAGAIWVNSIEEADDDFMNRTFDVNVFGPIRITQCVLSHFRAKKAGTIVFMGSFLAWYPIPFFAHYSAAKAALDAFVDGLQKEVNPFGIRTACIAAGGFATDLGVPREGEAGVSEPQITDYKLAFQELSALMGAPRPNDVRELTGFLARLVHDEGEYKGHKWPKRVVFGFDALKMIEGYYEELGDTLSTSRQVLESTQGGQ